MTELIEKEGGSHKSIDLHSHIQELNKQDAATPSDFSSPIELNETLFQPIPFLCEKEIDKKPAVIDVYHEHAKEIVPSSPKKIIATSTLIEKPLVYIRGDLKKITQFMNDILTPNSDFSIQPDSKTGFVTIELKHQWTVNRLNTMLLKLWDLIPEMTHSESENDFYPINIESKYKTPFYCNKTLVNTIGLPGFSFQDLSTYHNSFTESNFFQIKKELMRFMKVLKMKKSKKLSIFQELSADIDENFGSIKSLGYYAGCWRNRNHKKLKDGWMPVTDSEQFVDSLLKNHGNKKISY